MTPQQQADKINNFIANFHTLVADSFETATLNLYTEMHERIFMDNLTVEGFGFGSYSTKPAYFTQKQFVVKGNFKPQGKNESSFGKKVAKYKKEDSYNGTSKSTAYVASTGEDRKSMYLRNGYKELRAIQGRPVDKINLQYSFELAINGIITNTDGGVYQIKFANLLSEQKGRGFEKRKREKIFKPNKQESFNARKYIANNIVGELKKAFGNV